MPAVEYEPIPQQPQPEQQGVEPVPETPSIPEQVEKATGAQAVPSQPAPVIDDQTGQVVAQPVVTDPSTGNQIPDDTTLKAWSKGSANDSKTWLAVFWERLRKMMNLK